MISPQQPCQYELERAERIANNQSRLESLGIVDAVRNLTPAAVCHINPPTHPSTRPLTCPTHPFLSPPSLPGHPPTHTIELVLLGKRLQI